MKNVSEPDLAVASFDTVYHIFPLDSKMSACFMYARTSRTSSGGQRDTGATRFRCLAPSTCTCRVFAFIPASAMLFILVAFDDASRSATSGYG